MMTASEEREYLIDLLFESARWKVDHDEVLNGLELEIRDRLRRLSGVNTIDEEGLCQSDLPDNLPAEEEALTGADYQALEAAKLNEHLSNKANTKRKWASKRVRVIIDGKPTWKLRSDCHKEVMPGWKTKMHWVWNGPDGKQEQCDAMWAEHEQGDEA
jgi:hypothetical protein